MSEVIPVTGAVAHPGSLREWYAAYTMSRHEKRVAAHCERIGIEYFLPLYLSRRKWKNRTTVDLELPLFPNYVFVQLEPGDYGPLLRIPGLLSTVGNAAGPVTIPGSEIEALRRVVKCERVEPHPSIAVGDRVRVSTGPLEGITGVVVRTGNSLRLVVTLDLIGKGISVEIDARAVEFIGPRTPAGATRGTAVA